MRNALVFLLGFTALAMAFAVPVVMMVQVWMHAPVN